MVGRKARAPEADEVIDPAYEMVDMLGEEVLGTETV